MRLSLLDQLIAFGGGALQRGECARRCSAPSIAATWGGSSRRLSRADGPALLAQVRELDRDAPDYDRALVDLAALLQRIAIVQIVPEAAQQDEEFDAQSLVRLGGAMSAEDVQLYYQIALAGRRDLPMAPEPRLGFRNDPAADAGVSPRYGGRGGEYRLRRRSPAGAAAARRAVGARRASSARRAGGACRACRVAAGASSAAPCRWLLPRRPCRPWRRLGY